MILASKGMPYPFWKQNRIFGGNNYIKQFLFSTLKFERMRRATPIEIGIIIFRKRKNMHRHTSSPHTTTTDDDVTTRTTRNIKSVA